MNTKYLTSKDGSLIFNFDAMAWQPMRGVAKVHLCDGGILARKSAEINALVNCVELGGAIVVVPFNA